MVSTEDLIDGINALNENLLSLQHEMERLSDRLAVIEAKIEGDDGVQTNQPQAKA